MSITRPRWVRVVVVLLALAGVTLATAQERDRAGHRRDAPGSDRPIG